MIVKTKKLLVFDVCNWTMKKLIQDKTKCDHIVTRRFTFARIDAQNFLKNPKKRGGKRCHCKIKNNEDPIENCFQVGKKQKDDVSILFLDKGKKSIVRKAYKHSDFFSRNSSRDFRIINIIGVKTLQRKNHKPFFR
jgi:hypothetical protein